MQKRHTTLPIESRDDGACCLGAVDLEAMISPLPPPFGIASLRCRRDVTVDDDVKDDAVDDDLEAVLFLAAAAEGGGKSWA